MEELVLKVFFINLYPQSSKESPEYLNFNSELMLFTSVLTNCVFFLRVSQKSKVTVCITHNMLFLANLSFIQKMHLDKYLVYTDWNPSMF